MAEGAQPSWGAADLLAEVPVDLRAESGGMSRERGASGDIERVENGRVP